MLINDKLSRSDRAEKVKQHEAVLASQQRFSTWACESKKYHQSKVWSGDTVIIIFHTPDCFYASLLFW